jgi:hypothetical protein
MADNVWHHLAGRTNLNATTVRFYNYYIINFEGLTDRRVVLILVTVEMNIFVLEKQP